jgi:hypothetical protein
MLGLSYLVDLILIPLSLTLLVATFSGSIMIGAITSSYVLDCGEGPRSRFYEMIHVCMG